MRLNNEIVIITGGVGLLGRQYAEAVKEIGGHPVLLDINQDAIKEMTSLGFDCYFCDITDENSLNAIKEELGPSIAGLINNAAIDPKFESSSTVNSKSRFENYSLENWKKELDVGLTGAFLCTKIFAPIMAKNKKGSIINISSVLGLVAPNQELYRNVNLKEEQQPVKPVTYSVIKHGIIGLTKYTATYWGKDNVRCNAVAPGGVFNNHSEEFVQKLSKYIPMGRMAKKHEYNGVIKFLLTDESSFINGSIISADGGQVVW